MKNKKFVASAVSAALVASVVAPVVANAATGEATTKTNIKDVRLKSATVAKVYYKNAKGQTVSKDVKLKTPTKHLSQYSIIPWEGKNVRWNYNERVQLPQQKSYAKYIARAQAAVAADDMDAAKTNLEIAKKHFNNMNAQYFSASTIQAYKEKIAAVEAAIAQSAKVVAINSTTIEVTMKENVVDVKALNFTIEGLEVKNVAAKEADAKTVVLTTSEQEGGKTYTVQESGKDIGTFQGIAANLLSVSSVEATNLKEINVNLTKAVKNVSASNLKVTVDGAVQSNYTTLLSEDKKAITITNKNVFKQGAKVTLEVSGLVSEAGETMAAASKHELVVADTTAPTITDVKAVGTNKFEVSFSEPLKTQPSIKVNNGTISNVVSFKEGDKSAIVTTSTLTDGTSYKVEVEGGTDFAGLVVAKTEQDFTYEVLKDAPTVTINSSSEKSVTLKFNRPVENFTSASTLLRHTYNNTSNEVKGNSAAVEQISPSEYKVTFANAFPPGTTKLYISYTDGLANTAKVKDLFGNVLEATSLDVTTVVDTTKPTVSSVEYDKTGKIIVKFSEDLQEVSANSFVLKDKNGNVVKTDVPKFQVVSGNTLKNVVEITPTNTLAEGTYSLEVKNLKDASVTGNVIDTTVQTFTVGDVTGPTVSKVVKTATNELTVVFSEAVNELEAGNKENYFLNDNKALTSDTSITRVNDRTYKLTFVDANSLTGVTSLFVTGTVKDLAGNKVGNGIGSSATIVAAIDAVVKTADISDVTAVAKNQVTFKINQAISDIKNITVANQAATVKTELNSDGSTLVTATLSKDVLDTEGKYNSATTQVSIGEVTNAFGKSTTITKNVDKETIAPEIAKAEVKKLDNGKVTEIHLTMSEAIEVSSIQPTDFDFSGFKAEKVLATGNQVVVTVQEADYKNDTTVKLVDEISDTNGNTGKVNPTTPVKVVKASDIQETQTHQATTSEELTTALAAAKTGDTIKVANTVEVKTLPTEAGVIIDGGKVTADNITTDVTIKNAILDAASTTEPTQINTGNVTLENCIANGVEVNGIANVTITGGVLNAAANVSEKDDFGGLYVTKGNVTLDGVTVNTNGADDSKNANGILVTDGSLTVKNSTINVNDTENNAYGIYVTNSDASTATLNVTVDNATTINVTTNKKAAVYGLEASTLDLFKQSTLSLNAKGIATGSTTSVGLNVVITADGKDDTYMTNLKAAVEEKLKNTAVASLGAIAKYLNDSDKNVNGKNDEYQNTAAPTLVKAVALAANQFDAENDTLVLTFDKDVKLGDELQATGNSLDIINDLLHVDYDGATGDEPLVAASGGIPTFDVIVAGKTVTITIKGTGATLAEALTTTSDIKIADTSNIVDNANGKDVNSNMVDVTDVQ